jgi:hypothetical protein
MGARDAKPPQALGFFTVVQHEQHGMFGGYLLLNAGGRPLEFHCTAPVKASRAQEILFGPVLESYLYGEQIGQTLIAKAKLKPALVCVDLAAAMAVREHVDLPVTLVLPSEEGESESGGKTYRLDTAGHRFQPFVLGRNRLAVAGTFAADQQCAAEFLASIAEHFDLNEPFARIRGAIEEAQRAGR